MKSYVESERCCETAFKNNEPFWHLCTPGNASGIIFRNNEDYRFAMNLVARTKLEMPYVKILSFALMSNHVHFVLSCTRDMASEFFKVFKKRLQRYLISQYGDDCLDGFTENLIPILDLKQLRNTIVYVNRNGFVVHPEHTPFSYPWGTGRYYFNSLAIQQKRSDLAYCQIRNMFRSRYIVIPDDFLIIDGHIAPVSYCELEEGMSYFRDAHHYFVAVSRNVEAYTEIAAILNEKEFLTDDELFNCTLKICRTKYNNAKIKSLELEQKVELANELHYTYKASNEQIGRILYMNQYEIDSLFPLSASDNDNDTGTQTDQ